MHADGRGGLGPPSCCDSRFQFLPSWGALWEHGGCSVPSGRESGRSQRCLDPGPPGRAARSPRPNLRMTFFPVQAVPSLFETVHLLASLSKTQSATGPSLATRTSSGARVPAAMSQCRWSCEFLHVLAEGRCLGTECPRWPRPGGPAQPKSTFRPLLGSHPQHPTVMATPRAESNIRGRAFGAPVAKGQRCLQQ